MAVNDYHFTTTWRVEGTVAEVRAILGDAADLPRWWPAVCLSVQETEPGGPDGVGKIFILHTKGWLPYTLRWQCCVTEAAPDRLALQASGAFAGTGVWTFIQAGPEVSITHDWAMRARRRLLRWSAWLLRPICAANHAWAMRQGEISLRLELARRRAPDDEARSRIPDPPGPTPASFGLLLLSPFLVAAAVLVIAGIRRLPAGEKSNGEPL